ncbi:globin [Specibacter sp. RAF43]|uniref:globin n=1 Tax=Specibacter sp. RAF43 TaxID=3233057 RepID=UPI003F9DFA83
MLPIPERVGRPLPSTSSPSAGSDPAAEPGKATGEHAGEYADEAAYADTFYGQIGGHATFEKIIRVFYEGIAADPLLRAMYVEEDLGPAERRMLMFLEQYWGGPRTYLEERGHPRLRMRHVPFAVTPEARDRWLAAMRKGVDAANLSPMHEATLWDYLERAAASLVNAASDPSQRA